MHFAPRAINTVIILGRGLVTLALFSSAVVLAHPGIDEQIVDVSLQITKTPNDASLFIKRGELHRIHREWNLAARDFNSATRIEPQRAVTDFHIARLWLDRGKPRKALRHVDRYLQKKPKGVVGHIVRGQALATLGHHRGAADAYTRAIDGVVEGRPRPDDYLERARALQAAGPRYRDEAIRGLDEGIERLGAPITLLRLAIELELEADRFDAALARLDRIASGATRKERWLTEQADILVIANRPSEALSTYRAALIAIEGLPQQRRYNNATQRLEQQIREALLRLDGTE